MSAPPRDFGFLHPQAFRASVRIPDWSGQRRVVHLTDLHFGLVTPLGLQQAAVALANAAQPDLILLTGDFVCRSLAHLAHLTDVLAQLEAPAFAVLGNHDYWLDGDAVHQALEHAGVTVLSNQWTRLWSGEESLALVGMDDAITGHADPRSATLGVGNTPTLALSHAPDAAPTLWARGAPVVLSGHTHGGQLHVPRWTRAFWQGVLKVRYVDGCFLEDGGLVYVNPGVGSSVMPWRYGRPAQRTVAILDLIGGSPELPLFTAWQGDH
jgi:uncharacterized protein